MNQYTEIDLFSGYTNQTEFKLLYSNSEKRYIVYAYTFGKQIIEYYNIDEKNMY